MAQLNTRIVLRNDNAEKWTAADVNSDLVLLKGEIGLEYDTAGKVKMKVGDGTTNWTALPYFGGEEANVYQVGSYEELPTEDVAIGDTGIVKVLIHGDKYSHTGYVYTENGWVAMDGNYNANNVYFNEDLITSFAMGNVSLTNGMATINATGKNLKEVWESIYVKEINTELKDTAPSCTVSGNSTKYYLVGAASSAQTLTLGLNKGSYDYGYGYVESKDETDPADGTPAVTRVTNDGTGVVPKATSPYTMTYNGSALNPTTTNGNVFSCGSVTKTTAPSQVTAKGTVNYINAGNPVSNLGKIYATQAYANNSASTSDLPLSRWYYPMYKGFTYTDGTGKTAVVEDHANITADRIKLFDAVVDADAYNKTQTKTATASKAWRQYYYAFPASYNWVMKNAKDGNNIDCTIHKAADVTLTFNGQNVVYNVYYINNAADYGTLKITWSF